MARICIVEGATDVVLDGPSKLPLALAQYDEQEGSARRKELRFRMQELAESRIGHSTTVERISRIVDCTVVGVIRKNPNDKIGNDWVLWVISGGVKCIIYYSTSTRTGSAIRVKTFPRLAQVDYVLDIN